jgi:hypothetical protein
MEPLAIIGDAVAGQSAELRKHIRLLAQDLQKNTFDLAEAFLKAQESRCYTEWGFETFGEYATLELGVKPRKAQYLSRIVRVCRECGVARLDYEPVGVTKLREITSLDPGASYFNPETRLHEPMVEHIVRLIAEAPELNTGEVEEEVAKLKGMTGANSMVSRSYKVTLSAWENTIKRCFESIRKRLGSKGRDGMGAAIDYPDGTVIECLCAEYLGDLRNFMEDDDANQPATAIRRENSTRGGTPIQLASEEVPQDSLQGPHKPFEVPAEQ